MKSKKADRIFLMTIIFLTIFGFSVFASASLGLLARDGARFSGIAFNQSFFGLFLGSIACFVLSKIHYRLFRKYALHIFIAGIILTLLVFAPKLGFTLNGARRWLSIGGISFQPTEFLKIAFVIYFAAWLSGVKEKIATYRYGFLPFLALIAVIGAIMLKQPDTDGLIVIAMAGFGIFITAGGRWKDILVLILGLLTVIAVMAFFRPYLMNRFLTFFNPAANSSSSGYQIQQSLIAIGSGEMFGRGFGQSVQKFKFLPESMSDSIFAVASEEFGFVGSFFIILLFVFFVFRGFKIALKSPDMFGGLLVVGIVILVVSQSFINIASMLGVIPLSGLPLVFFSQGGTAMFFTLAEMGIILNVSKHGKSA
ncbi:MAG: FtsW/RodA/SpoVE family cell cycle protein [Patescibacteria group bacterium]|nr:FtsW/RodA/SpoVE family cell cycle protein [Patescibacteria group bacterium]MDE1988342.1 FtsW/RodA/SpoVE family cell cycle protein [Patescibacteria group bacterium]MDE2218161.1 FtsW/RodA/SpoVE family cell cycle protein [Patescibacteria group bacterium]